jgi:hypothetical protein
MQKFQQNGLLNNVNLAFSNLKSKDFGPVLCHILPLINGIVSIAVRDIAQLAEIYSAGNSKEIYELNMKLMEKREFWVSGRKIASDYRFTTKLQKR